MRAFIRHAVLFLAVHAVAPCMGTTDVCNSQGSVSEVSSDVMSVLQMSLGSSKSPSGPVGYEPVSPDTSSLLQSDSEAEDVDANLGGLSGALEYNVSTTFYGRPVVFWKTATGAEGSSPITLDSPAETKVPYHLQNPESTFFSQWQQDHYLWPKVLAPITQYYLSRQRYPFFVESGARDGEAHSNTLFLEREKAWEGVLIEPSILEYPHLLEKKRKCYSWQGCLSPTGKSETLQFLDSGDGLSRLSKHATSVTVKAESLLSLLQAINTQSANHTVDFWSLDIEGSEGPVLETTDFEAIEFGVLMIEMNKGKRNNDRIRRVMEANHFVEIGGTRYDEPGPLDIVFVNPKYFEARRIPMPELVEGLMPPTWMRR